MATVDRRPYLTAMVLDQALLDQMADNCEFALEMVADVDAKVSYPLGVYVPVEVLRVSDRNKYVGSTFYKARCELPVIKKTLGEWLAPAIEFSTLELPISNVLGDLNRFLQGGADYTGWVGHAVAVKLGIRDIGATFTTIYKGRVTDIGGLARDRMKITVRTRDDMDRLNKNFPNTALTQATFPDLEDDRVGTILPVIYGDFTVAPLQLKADPPNAPILAASVPAFPVNGKHANVLDGSANIRLLISENINSYFDDANVWVKRGEVFEAVPSADIVSVVDNRDFQIVQGFAYGPDADPYVYETGDEFYVRVKGPDLGAYDDNIVEQARDILKTYGGAVTGDFASSWDTYRDRTVSPGNIFSIKSRVWLQEPETAVTYALSMLEQVRLEMCVDRDLKLAIRALWFEDFVSAPTHLIRQWDIKEGTLSPKLDDRNAWNRARAEYALDPAKGSQARQTAIYKIQGAVDQAGREISKKVIFPNLYVEGDVVNQLGEMLRLATGNPEFIEMTVTPRSMLLDLGDFVALTFDMGSIVMAGVPGIVREIGYDPKGGILLKIWSMQTTPFPGWTPGYAGTVGGYAATITQE